MQGASGVAGLGLVLGSTSIGSRDVASDKSRFSLDGAASEAMCVGFTSTVAG